VAADASCARVFIITLVPPCSVSGHSEMRLATRASIRSGDEVGVGRRGGRGHFGQMVADLFSSS